MSSLILSVNFKKGWPCPSIVDRVAQPGSGVTVFEGAVAHIDPSSDKWVLGISAGDVTQTPYVLWNGAGGNGDQYHPFDPTKHYAQAGYGGVQGISFINQIEVETGAFNGTPAVGDQLYAGADGKLATCTANTLKAAGVANAVVVAICTEASHKMASGPTNVNVISFVPDMSKRIITAAA